MPTDNQLWSCVGSAGAVDPADLSKVVFSNSVVQLGPGGAVVAAPTAAAARLVRPETQAVIRYGVTPVEGVLDLGNYGLRLCLREGSGQVTAKLMQVSVATSAETPIVTFSSSSGSRTFQAKTQGGWEGQLDFYNNSYYVELTLAAVENPVEPLLYPPAVSVIQIVPGLIL